MSGAGFISYRLRGLGRLNLRRPATSWEREGCLSEQQVGWMFWVASLLRDWTSYLLLPAPHTACTQCWRNTLGR